jgi:hypothetical protein
MVNGSLWDTGGGPNAAGMMDQGRGAALPGASGSWRRTAQGIKEAEAA